MNSSDDLIEMYCVLFEGNKYNPFKINIAHP